MTQDSRRGMEWRCIGLLGACVLAGFLWGMVDVRRSGAQATPPDQEALDYKLPRRGAPGGREGGGSRGPQGALPVVLVLAPQEHTGLTVQEQPVLYWYLSQETQQPIEVTLTDRHSVKPLLEQRLAAPLKPGVHQLRLADYGIRLTPGVVYKWAVALVPDPAQRSQDVVTAGVIERIALSDELHHRLTQAGPAAAPRLYAEAGLWYDLLAALAERIAAAPREVRWRQQRATLLDKEGLPEVAAYDRQQ